MPKLSIFEIGSIIRERLFRTAEKKHLRHMRQHNAEKERAAHADFLSKIHDVPQKNEHQHKIEHNGVDFWSYYFGGEEPPLDNVLPPHMQQHWDETQMHIYSHTISPEFSLLKPKEDGVGDAAETIERRWLQKFTLAKLAQEHNNLAEAEENFRLCLKDCIDFKEPSRKKALSAKGLAEVLQKRGNLNEADQYYTMAARIDEELLGEGDTTLESEFYSIAGHLIQDGNWQDVEVLYKDLAERLRMTCGRNDPRLARCLNQLAIGYCSERKWQTAEALFKTAIRILEQCEPKTPKQLSAAYNNYAALKELMGDHDAAEDLYLSALETLNESSDSSAAQSRTVDKPPKEAQLAG